MLLIAGFSAAGRWQASGPTHGPGNPSPWGNAILGFLAFLAQNSSCVSLSLLRILKPARAIQSKAKTGRILQLYFGSTDTIGGAGTG